MILYVKTLGASSTVMGAVAGMLPLLVIFQIPAASFINQVGYRRFVLTGWGVRSIFVFGLAFVPLTAGCLDAPTQLVGVILMLFGFNLLTSISGCAWLPWMAGNFPEKLFGRYLAGDSAMANLGSFVTVILAAAWLGSEPPPWRFAGLFFFCAIAGLTSLIFLRRIPDAAIPEAVCASKEPVPWLEMLRYQPFQKLLCTTVVWSAALGGTVVFVILFLKTDAGLSAGKIMLVTSVSFLGGLGSMLLLGHRLDHVGSKPMLGFAFGGWLLIMAGWLALAGGVLTAALPLLFALQFFMGFFAALVVIATNRLAVTIAPPMGRAHFLAIYSVIGNVTLGLAPVAWGLLMDAIGDWHARWLGLTWDRFTILFAAVTLMFAVALGLACRLEEPKAVSLEELLIGLLIKSPQRLWLRFWTRT